MGTHNLEHNVWYYPQVLNMSWDPAMESIDARVKHESPACANSLKFNAAAIPAKMVGLAPSPD